MKSRWWLYAIVLLFFTALLSYWGCANKQSGYFAGSCDSGIGTCFEFTGSSYTKENVETGCTGVYSSSICTTTSLVGGCVVDQGTAIEMVIRYYSPTYDAGTAQFDCTVRSGTWQP